MLVRRAPVERARGARSSRSAGSVRRARSQRVVQRRRLDRLRHDRADAGRVPSGSAATSRWPTDEASTTGTRAARSWIRAARSSPSMPGISMSRTARSNRAVRRAPPAPLASGAASTSRCPTRRAARISRGSSRCRPRRALGVRRTTPSRRSAVGVMSVAPASIVKWNVLPSPGTPVLSTHDRAAHQLGEPPADREAEPGAAVPAGRRGVGLAERLEQPVDAVRRDADAGVADGEVEPDASRAASRARSTPRRRPRRSR